MHSKCINTNKRGIKMHQKSETEKLLEKYEFRNIQPEEIIQTAEIEQICFPPN